MNTKTSMSSTTSHVQAAIARLEEYLLTTSESNADIELENNMLYVKFKNGLAPTDEIVQRVREIFFWADTVSIPHIDGLVHYYPSCSSLLINLVYYDEISAVYEKLKGLGTIVKSFDLVFREYVFSYDVIGRNNLVYDELLEIEQLIAPAETEELKHISVFRMGKYYTLTIKHAIW